MTVTNLCMAVMNCQCLAEWVWLY